MLFVVIFGTIVILQFIIILIFLVCHTSPVRVSENVEMSLPTVDGVIVSIIPNDERIIVVVDM